MPEVSDRYFGHCIFCLSSVKRKGGVLRSILPVLFGAYFHDSIEDARLTYNDVMKIAKKLMSDEQAFLATEIVYALTNEKGRNRHERANEKPGYETRNTFYMHFKHDNPFFLDYTYSKLPVKNYYFIENLQEKFSDHIGQVIEI